MGSEEDWPSVTEEEMILCICLSKGKLGAACFDVDRGILRCLEDVDEDVGHIPVLKRVLYQTQPTVLLLSRKLAEPVLSQVEALRASPGGTYGHPSASIVKLAPSELDFSACKSAVINFFAMIGSRAGSAAGKIACLLSVDFEATCMVRSLGALIKYCNINGVLNAENTTRGGMSPCVFRVQPLELSHILVLDENAYHSLQIFKAEFHPSVYKAGHDGTKEGFSLYAVCNRCMSVAGATELRRMFRQPLRDVEAIRERLDVVEFFADDNNLHLVNTLQRALRHLSPLGNILCHLRVSTMSNAVWIRLHDILERCLYLIDILKGNRKTLPALLFQMSDCALEDLRSLRTEMIHVIDFASMRREKRVIVRSGVDTVLDEKRWQLENLPKMLTTAAQQEVHRLPFRVPECSVVYAPMIGYMVSVPHLPQWKRQEDYQQPDMQFLFVSNNRVHYKTALMEQLDVDLGDLRMDIIDRELAIILELRDKILQKAPNILHIVYQAIQLDSWISLAVTARELNWTRPVVCDGCMLEVEGSRHPLVELRTAPFVVNPIRSGDEKQGRLHVLTSPNAAGKSVYIKQVGTIVFLAHIGSFVPAVKATIPICDRILCRLHSVDSVLSNMSTFSCDLKQMAVAVNEATSRSVVLVDEFGKGTLTDVGLALLAACLQYWLEQGAQCPHIFVSTHLHGLLKVLPPSPHLKFLTMKVLRRSSELIYLYTVTAGVSSHSYAAYAAVKAGLPNELVERIHKVYQMQKRCELLRRPDKSDEQWKMDYEQSLKLVRTFLSYELLPETVPTLVNLIRNNISLQKNLAIERALPM